MSTSYEQNINWDELASAVRLNECVLVLGPNIATLPHPKSKQVVSLVQLLTEHLAKYLQSLGFQEELPEEYNLSFISRKIEDFYLPTVNFSPERARANLGSLISQFYKSYQHHQFPVYQKIASLPFQFIINTNPDNFLAAAFDDENKFAVINEYYHFKDPRYNNNIDITEGLISEDAPLVYNLFGSIESPDSLILTEGDRLFFLDAILQREKTATIPPSIAIHFTSAHKQNSDKTFVFLGFDFSQWHLRLIMHLINRYQKLKETYALQDPTTLNDLTTFFYKRNFEVQFINNNPGIFLDHFAYQLTTRKHDKKLAAELKVFLMYAKEDEVEKQKLDAQLSPLKRNEIIQTWDEEQLLPGIAVDEAINHQLSSADIIILLVTPSFFNTDEIYEKQLQLAIDLHNTKKSVVIPILIKSCLWRDLLGSFTTILPRNKTPLNEQVDETAALADIVAQLDKFCRKIYQRKKNINL